MNAYSKVELIKKLKILVPKTEQVVRISDYSSFPYEETKNVELKKYMDCPINK